MDSERIIKKYPNRRLYDTAISCYVVLDDIRRLVREGVKFRVVDARSEEDITRSILLQVILEEEERGRPILSQEVLEHIIRSYGDAMQGFMTAYLEQSLAVFLRQQSLVREQMAALIETAPTSVFSGIARENLKLWQSFQDGILERYGVSAPRPETEDGNKLPESG
jgi:polyhydroxyalkanoate synthesis repressor PhaR